ncbi:hypothetical protein Hanom_Chr11g01024441 [Helianthus anomalus]
MVYLIAYTSSPAVSVLSDLSKTPLTIKRIIFKRLPKPWTVNHQGFHRFFEYSDGIFNADFSQSIHVFSNRSFDAQRFRLCVQEAIDDMDGGGGVAGLDGGAVTVWRIYMEAVVWWIWWWWEW